MQQLAQLSDLLADRAKQPVRKAMDEVILLASREAEIENYRQALIKASQDPILASTFLKQANRLNQDRRKVQNQLDLARERLSSAQKGAYQAIGRNNAVEDLIKKQNRNRKAEEGRKAYR